MQACTSLQTDNHASIPPLSDATRETQFEKDKTTVWIEWPIYGGYYYGRATHV